MYLVQVLVPLADRANRPFSREPFERIQRDMTARFGGVTAYVRAPAEGAWRAPSGSVAQDEVVIVEVMCEQLDRAFWADYRKQLEAELDQEELVVRALPFERL